VRCGGFFDVVWLWKVGRFARRSNKLVDASKETPHNLISLLLTNKTIRGVAPGAEAEAKFFKN
jgi:hypothetical protein